MGASDRVALITQVNRPGRRSRPEPPPWMAAPGLPGLARPSVGTFLCEGPAAPLNEG
jgi:hypothetical protein